MDLEFIERVIRLVEEAEIGELELEHEGLRIVVKKKAPSELQSSSAYPMMYPAQAPPAVPPPAPEAAQPSSAPSEDEAVEVVKAPMVGSFYRSPSPDSPAYVEVGQKVHTNTVVCILEAMKVMNEIKAGVEGTVVDVLAENGEAVEYGQPLFKIKTER